MISFIGELVLLFVVVTFAIRLMGKTALAQLSPIDLAALVFLVTLAVTPIKIDGKIQAIIGIMVVVTIYILFSKISLLQAMNRLFIGQPSILVKHGKISKRELDKSRFSLVELLSAIRIAGYPDIEDIEYVILEPNGELSILPNHSVVNITPKHLNIETEYKGIPIAVVIEGKIQIHNLKKISRDETWLYHEIKRRGIDLKEIFYASVNDKDYSLYIDKGKP
ncbi:DUF421 domain-containing protein [Pseudalkalibacillus salsuginis]|uniref:DUF421 domain-containing protein n=1 Tax=Pseudalkalibacillus salsuginis TaxID=2910972 RepID=UPI001F3B1B2C|nr:YetF domain-containing protein [Pseudalkalibacillus salsuginis]MCF6408801.1 DUF421 domain-containing protein [Pseudalkalibacillus salsuginis]